MISKNMLEALRDLLESADNDLSDAVVVSSDALERVRELVSLENGRFGQDWA